MTGAQRPFAVIVAASENDVIGRRGQLPWHISRDLRRFKRLTTGHSIVMGRKTYESLGRLLPGRRTIIVTRQEGYQIPQATIVHTLPELLDAVRLESQPFVIGGSDIFRWLLPSSSWIFLTRVHAEVEGESKLPEINWDEWDLTHEEFWPADAKNQFDVSFKDYIRR